MPARPRPLSLVILLLTLVGRLGWAAGEGRGAELIAAAQRGDVAGVRALLEAGVPVDAANRYGATALFSAVDRANLELVSVLIEAGADVNVEDTFYKSTPLGWALFQLDDGPEYREIALRLLGSGAGPAGQAVRAAARRGDLGLLEAALETGGVTDEDRRAAISRLEEAEDQAAAEEMIARLAEGLPADGEAPKTTAEAAGEQDAAEEGDGVESAAAAPLPEPVRRPAIQWPSFRGPNASGIADGQGVPTRWNGTDGTNVVWKTGIPGIALASPVIWGERVFVATAVSEDGDESLRVGLYGDVDSVEDESEYVWRLLALDRGSGEVLWQREAARGRPKVKRHLKSSHANSTPAVDDRHVVVLFPSEGLFCFDHRGELLWRKDLGVFGSGWFFDPTYEWGFASSPIIHDGRVIVQADIYQGSFLAAWDLETGEEAWRTERDEIPSWSTPTILPGGPDGPDEIVTNGKTVRGYDAATGEELWTLGPNSEIVVGTPVVAGGLAYVTGGYPPARPIYAVRPGGRGDLSLAEGERTSPHLAWSEERGGTYTPTPIVYEGILYLLNNNGRLAAYDAATGESIYRQRVGGGGSFTSSPIAADGRLFITSEEGTTWVVRAGRVYAELAENPLGEIVMSTPAASDGLLVVRGMRHVYGIGAGGKVRGARSTESISRSPGVRMGSPKPAWARSSLSSSRL